MDDLIDKWQLRLQQNQPTTIYLYNKSKNK